MTDIFPNIAGLQSANQNAGLTAEIPTPMSPAFPSGVPPVETAQQLQELQELLEARYGPAAAQAIMDRVGC
jgi:hypothetical protein